MPAVGHSWIIAAVRIVVYFIRSLSTADMTLYTYGNHLRNSGRSVRIHSRILMHSTLNSGIISFGLPKMQ